MVAKKKAPAKKKAAPAKTARPTTIESGRPEAVILPLVIPADNPGYFLGSFHRIIRTLFHRSTRGATPHFHQPKCFSAVLLPIGLHDQTSFFGTRQK